MRNFPKCVVKCVSFYIEQIKIDPFKLNLDCIMPNIVDIELGDANVKRVCQNGHPGTEQSIQRLLQ